MIDESDQEQHDSQLMREVLGCKWAGFEPNKIAAGRVLIKKS